jgi:hypothetical protein
MLTMQRSFKRRNGCRRSEVREIDANGWRLKPTGGGAPGFGQCLRCARGKKRRGGAGCAGARLLFYTARSVGEGAR